MKNNKLIKKEFIIKIDNCFCCPFSDSFGYYCLIGDWDEKLKHPTEKMVFSKCPIRNKKIILEV